MKEHFVSTDKDYQTHVYYLKFALKFADDDITELVSSFNREVHNKGLAGMRVYHDRALIDEFIRRGIDVSCVCDGNSINFNHQVRFEVDGRNLVNID